MITAIEFRAIKSHVPQTVEPRYGDNFEPYEYYPEAIYAVCDDGFHAIISMTPEILDDPLAVVEVLGPEVERLRRHFK